MTGYLVESPEITKTTRGPFFIAQVGGKEEWRLQEAMKQWSGGQFFDEGKFNGSRVPWK